MTIEFDPFAGPPPPPETATIAARRPGLTVEVTDLSPELLPGDDLVVLQLRRDDAEVSLVGPLADLQAASGEMLTLLAWVAWEREHGT